MTTDKQKGDAKYLATHATIDEAWVMYRFAAVMIERLDRTATVNAVTERHFGSHVQLPDELRRGANKLVKDGLAVKLKASVYRSLLDREGLHYLIGRLRCRLFGYYPDLPECYPRSLARHRCDNWPEKFPPPDAERS